MTATGPLLLLLSLLGQAGPVGDAPPSTVAAIQAKHDRALLADLAAHLAPAKKPDDAEQGYLTLFNKAIEHDWFLDYETIATGYLKEFPSGPVRPLAQIVATMARAQAGTFGEALTRYKGLIDGLNGPDQIDFAANFADSLANSAISAGEVPIAREVYATLRRKFGEDSPSLKQKLDADLARLDRVGQPAPVVSAVDLEGKPFRLEELRGKYVLVDFWATWCAPCLEELPKLQAAREKFKARGFEVVGVSLDETKGAVVDFVRVRKLGWVQIHNATCSADLVQAFGVTTIPASFLVDPRGNVIRLDLHGAGLEKALDALLPR